MMRYHLYKPVSIFHLLIICSSLCAQPQQFSQAFIDIIQATGVSPVMLLQDEYAYEVPTADHYANDLLQDGDSTTYIRGSQLITVGASMYMVYQLYGLYLSMQAPLGAIGSMVPSGIRAFGSGIYCVAGVTEIAVKTMIYKTAAQLLLTATVGDLGDSVDYVLKRARRWVGIVLAG